MITTVKSLDPRVPNFQSPRIAESKNKTERVEESKRHQAVESDVSTLLESDCSKKTIPQGLFKPQATDRNDAVSKRKKTIVILDDYTSPGREVTPLITVIGERNLRSSRRGIR